MGILAVPEAGGLTAAPLPQGAFLLDLTHALAHQHHLHSVSHCFLAFIDSAPAAPRPKLPGVPVLHKPKGYLLFGSILIQKVPHTQQCGQAPLMWSMVEGGMCFHAHVCGMGRHWGGCSMCVGVCMWYAVCSALSALMKMGAPNSFSAQVEQSYFPRFPS